MPTTTTTSQVRDDRQIDGMVYDLADAEIAVADGQGQ
jgi:hypothetical protein